MAYPHSPDFYRCMEQHRTSLLLNVEINEEQLSKSSPAHQESITSPQVLAAIEKIIHEVLESLSKNQAPVLTLDNRSSWGNVEFNDAVGLQMVKRCTTLKVKSDSPRSAQRFALIIKILSVIHKLVQSNTYATKRDIYYNDVQLYGSQIVVDNIINDVSCMLKIPRISLHILTTSKGCLSGDLWFTEEDGTRVNCSGSSTGVLVPSNIEGITKLCLDMRSQAKFILIIEKDATFQRLLDDEFCTRFGPCILITGKGFPDVNTRRLTRKLWDHFHIPIFTLVDADPHGIEIMCTCKYGSLSMSFEAHHLTVPSISWLGVLPSDLERLNIPSTALIPLTAFDQRKLSSLLRRPYITSQPLWKRELEIMAACKMKAEIQALSSLSPTYLSRVYLPNKLQYGGWI
ncbi:meiotic recombination SPO11 isoform X1 [Pelobates cultripes]|uniref:DNA topoisomerase (ATP-hydrolyzing) n=1 Tax=Pelobates cultripes TaxID=61616 RepID=A0AAD1SQA3_PELCU|nr:meiotic recombination SPO11 isoform X1 [Pelobates cultripes]